MSCRRAVPSVLCGTVTSSIACRVCSLALVSAAVFAISALSAPQAHAAIASGSTLIYSTGGTLLSKPSDRRLRVYSDVSEDEQCRRGLKRCVRASSQLNALKRQQQLQRFGTTYIEDPVQAMSDRNDQRQKDVQAILRAVLYYAKDHKSSLPHIASREMEICATYSPDCRRMVDLSVMKSYLPSAPMDPLVGSGAYGTKYGIARDANRGTVTVRAMLAENKADIVATGEIGSVAVTDQTTRQRRFTQTPNRRTQSRIRALPEREITLTEKQLAVLAAYDFDSATLAAKIGISESSLLIVLNRMTPEQIDIFITNLPQ